MKTCHSAIIILGLLAASMASADGIPTAAYTRHVLVQDLSLPTDLAFGKQGQLFVVDSGNHRLVVLDEAGERLAAIGSQGSGEGQFESPVGIGSGPRGQIYVADSGNSRLQVLDAKGRIKRQIAISENGKAAVPVDVAVSPDGRELFVTTRGHRVLVYSSKGEFLRAWGSKGDGPGEFFYPGTIAVDSNGDVYVVDVLNSRIQKFSGLGIAIAEIGTRGGKPGTFFRPKGVAVDASGRIYVSDSFLGILQVFDDTGEFLHVVGREGVATIFETAVGIATDDARVAVSQMLPGVVTILEPPATTLAGNGTEGRR